MRWYFIQKRRKYNVRIYYQKQNVKDIFKERLDFNKLGFFVRLLKFYDIKGFKFDQLEMLL